MTYRPSPVDAVIPVAWDTIANQKGEQFDERGRFCHQSNSLFPLRAHSPPASVIFLVNNSRNRTTCSLERFPSTITVTGIVPGASSRSRSVILKGLAVMRELQFDSLASTHSFQNSLIVSVSMVRQFRSRRQRRIDFGTAPHTLHSCVSQRSCHTLRYADSRFVTY